MRQDQFIREKQSIPIKIIVGLVVFLAIVIYLIVSSTQATAEYFLTVDEVLAQRNELAGKNIRVSGVVLGDSIHYEPDSLTLSFTIAHIDGDNAAIEQAGGLSAALHDAATDPDRHTINVVYRGVKPDLMKDESQVILTGTLNRSGAFIAKEVLLKCPTKYKQAVPDQVETR
ncbi:MAG: cytochrome c maturation protein CcmE [Chloroflexi bacterium]|jgi:cytochrome c-type biogenesis protein CcmE|nr:cytochrome c maturation protein CcmE [Chloroflexota bacterium]BCY17767.1 hypothetical protein hrd7_16160 [Leptolinea sp. HRD-7]